MIPPPPVGRSRPSALLPAIDDSIPTQSLRSPDTHALLPATDDQTRPDRDETEGQTRTRVEKINVTMTETKKRALERIRLCLVE